MPGNGFGGRRSSANPSITTASWRTWTPLVALVLALAGLVLLPVLRARLVEPLHEDLRSAIEPARSVVTRIHLALAMEGTLAREFMERRDTTARRGLPHGSLRRVNGLQRPHTIH